MYTSHVAFSLSISFDPKWCYQTVVLTLLELEKITILFYLRDQISIADDCYCESHIFNLVPS